MLSRVSAGGPWAEPATHAGHPRAMRESVGTKEGDGAQNDDQHARSFGCETVDVSASELPDQIEVILGVPEVDAAVDAVGVGVEAHEHGPDGAPPSSEARSAFADNINATMIPLSTAPQGYAESDQGAQKKLILDPHWSNDQS
ncbi:MAG: hypothetical protein ACRDSH_11480 [Pseudonocardiaceae bacterium]